MGWVAPLANIAAAKQAGAMGKYNQSVQERNATIAEQEAQRLEQQNEFDIARFDQQFTQLQQSQKMEEANFARMKGQVARMEAKQAQLGYYAAAGQSLMSNYGGG